MCIITEKEIMAFADYLQNEEKAKATIVKYLCAVRSLSCFLNWAGSHKGADTGIPGAAAHRAASADSQRCAVGHQCFSGFLRLAGQKSEAIEGTAAGVFR